MAPVGGTPVRRIGGGHGTRWSPGSAPWGPARAAAETGAAGRPGATPQRLQTKLFFTRKFDPRRPVLLKTRGQIPGRRPQGRRTTAREAHSRTAGPLHPRCVRGLVPTPLMQATALPEGRRVQTAL